MIELVNLSEVYHIRRGRHTVLDGTNPRITKGEKIDVLGRNGAGKSMVIRMISGVELSSVGKIYRGMSMSRPPASGGTLQDSLIGMNSLRFVCRVYGSDAKATEPFVQEFSELGYYLHESVKTYSAGMRTRPVFAISMAIESDCFLADEIIAVGDSRSHSKCRRELLEKHRDHPLIIVNHDADYTHEHCDSAAVLVQGKLHAFEQVDDAYTFYQESVG